MFVRVAYATTLAAAVATAILRIFGAPGPLLFLTSAVAILGLAWILGRSTEDLGHSLGHRVGGILNATVGNVGEIIISIFALRAGHVELVKASITGSVIGNLLLVFGASALLGGLRNGIQRFDPRTAGMNAVQLNLATAGLVVPAVFAFLLGGEARAENFLPVESVSIGVAVVLLVLYGLSIVYDFTRPPEAGPGGGEAATAAAGMEEGRSLGWRRPLVLLIVAAGLLAWMSEILVASLEPTIASLGVSEFFLGIIVIPVIGNLAEHLVGVQLAWKNRMDFSVAVCLGSSTQIALFAAPLLVFLSIPLGHPLTLVFTTFEVVAVALSALAVALIAIDGESNWLEGAQLVALYLILAVAFFFLRPAG